MVMVAVILAIAIVGIVAVTKIGINMDRRPRKRGRIRKAKGESRHRSRPRRPRPKSRSFGGPALGSFTRTAIALQKITWRNSRSTQRPTSTAWVESLTNWSVRSHRFWASHQRLSCRAVSWHSRSRSASTLIAAGAAPSPFAGRPGGPSMTAEPVGAGPAVLLLELPQRDIGGGLSPLSAHVPYA